MARDAKPKRIVIPSDAGWEAAIANALAEARDETVPGFGIPKYYKSLGALKEAADAVAARRGFKWKQHRERSATECDDKEAKRKLEHYAKCKKIERCSSCKLERSATTELDKEEAEQKLKDCAECKKSEECRFCMRARRLAVQPYQDTYEGATPEDRVIAQLFVSAACICPHKGTRCLGCVFEIKALDFPLTPHAPQSRKLYLQRRSLKTTTIGISSLHGGKRACPERPSKRAPAAKRARTSTPPPAKRSLSLEPVELSLSAFGPPRHGHGLPPSAREQTQDQAPTPARPVFALGASPLIVHGTVVFVNTQDSHGTNVHLHDINNQAGGPHPTARQAHAPAGQRELDFTNARAHDEDRATTNAAVPDSEYDGGDEPEQGADEADDLQYATPATPFRHARTIQPPPPAPRARGQPRRRHRASAQHTPDHQIDDEAAMAGVTNSPAAPAVAAGGNIEISFEANGNQNSAISISNIGNNY